MILLSIATLLMEIVPTALATSHLRAALVITDELGDKSFYDSSYQGLVRAEHNLDIYSTFFKKVI